MSQLHLTTVDELRPLVGQELVVTDWLLIDRRRVQLFADATDDHQWIHVDEERARRESPFGGPIAHGFLTLSLVGSFLQDNVHCPAIRMGVNYGLNRVRFVSPVQVGTQVRARLGLVAMEDLDGGKAMQLTWSVTIEIEGQARPACVAEALVRWYL